MAQIIEFRKKTSSSAERYKALAKGNIKTFKCDNCGTDFEVINNKYPDCCPGCGLVFTDFKHIEENT